MNSQFQANGINNASKRLFEDHFLIQTNRLNSENYLLHQDKILHMHDNEYTGIAHNCLGVNLEEWLRKNVCLESPLDIVIDSIFEFIVNLTNEQSGGIGVMNFDSDLAPYIEKESEDTVVYQLRRLYSLLNINVRKGYEKAYVTLNFGLDTTANGRKAITSILKAFELGTIIKNEPFIFPNLVMKLKKNINIGEVSPNYDLLRLSAQISGIRMNPTYFNCDSNHVQDISAEDVGIMGCRTLMAKNTLGKSGAVKRGNIAAISLNLPKIAKNSMNEADFYKNLELYVDKAKDVLIEKFLLLTKNPPGYYNYLVNNNLYLDCDNSTKKMFSNGSLSIGFIGVYEAIAYLEKNNSLTKTFVRQNVYKAFEIVSFLKQKTDDFAKKYKMNFSLLASSGEGISGRFAIDDKNYEFYTNSYHIPVYLNYDVFEKIDQEAIFSKLCNGGSITYVEFPTPIINNPEAILDVIKYGYEKNIQYLGVNFPLDYCNDCGKSGAFEKKECTKCNSENVQQLRRVSGYLSLKSTLKLGKQQEEKCRISHF